MLSTLEFVDSNAFESNDSIYWYTVLLRLLAPQRESHLEIRAVHYLKFALLRLRIPHQVRRVRPQTQGDVLFYCFSW